MGDINSTQKQILPGGTVSDDKPLLLIEGKHSSEDNSLVK
jgi:hypothetical protein